MRQFILGFIIMFFMMYIRFITTQRLVVHSTTTQIPENRKPLKGYNCQCDYVW